MLIADTINLQMDTIEYCSQKVKELQKAEKILEGIDLSTCRSISCSQYPKGLHIYLFLKDECKDSKLCHKITQKLGVTFDKEQNWDKTSLQATATGKDFTIVVSNYIPSTCEIITEEIPLTQKEIEEARSKVPIVRTVRTIKCPEKTVYAV